NQQWIASQIVKDSNRTSKSSVPVRKINAPLSHHREVNPMPRCRSPLASKTKLDLQLLRLEDRLAPSNSIPLNAVSWTPLGPTPINSGTAPGGISCSGRTSAIAAHPTDPNILYIGAASGGIWKTTNATAANPTWVPLTDNMGALTTGDIALAPSDP